MAGLDLRPIGIWEPDVQDGSVVFVRPKPGPLGDHYAADAVIHQAKPAGVTRVCLFGESVAAGYLYAPHLTPAMVLGRQHVLLGREVEVIDLARTNETLTPMVNRVEAAMQLSPDVLVLFGGNNWNLLETPEISPYYPDPEQRRELAALVQDQGLIGAEEAAAQTVMNRAMAVYGRIAALAKTHGCKVILVVPEVNMADWESCQPTPWLGAGNTAAWHTQLKAARRCQAQADWSGLAGAAKAMLALDGWSSPSGFHLLAKARLGLGDAQGARKAFVAEIDCDSYPRLCLLGSPRLGSLARELQIRAARFHQFGLVDCRQLFETHTKSPLPDRRLFLDYCHLTREGMALAMAGVCKAMGATDTPDLLDSSVTAVAPAADALAFFGAALHTAHRHPGALGRGELVDFWLGRALAVHPPMAQTMLDFLQVRAMPGPEILSSAHQSVWARPCPPLLQHGWRYDYSDLELLHQITVLLEDQYPQAQGLLQRAGEKLHSHGSGLEPVQPIEQFFPVLTAHQDPERRLMFRAVLPETSFWLWANGPVGLKMVLRLPPDPVGVLPREGLVRLCVDDGVVDEFRVGPQWRTYQSEAGLIAAPKGIFKLTIHWPMPSEDIDSKGMAHAVTRLEQGRPADWYPVFGELNDIKTT